MLVEAPGPGVGPARGVQMVDDAVALTGGESLEELASTGSGIEGLVQVGWDGRHAGRGVGGVPAAVLLCPVDLFEAGGSHLATRYEFFGCLPVEQGPSAGGSAGGEALRPPAVGQIAGEGLSIDPAELERAHHGLGSGG